MSYPRDIWRDTDQHFLLADLKGRLMSKRKTKYVCVLQEAIPGIIIKTSITGRQLVGDAVHQRRNECLPAS